MDMENKIGPVWVFAEQVEGRVLDVSLELIGKAQKFADSLKVSLEVILLGAEIENQIARLIAAGADRVFVGNDARLRLYQPELYSGVIVDLAQERMPEIFLLGSTPVGRELAPLVAGRLKTGLSAHCADLELDKENRLLQLIPAYGGLVSIVCPEKRPQMATIGKGVFPLPAFDERREGETDYLQIPVLGDQRVETLEFIREKQSGKPLENAEIVVAGGAGVGDKDGWQKIAELAKVLGGALGATRPPVDEGWIEEERMIGQSGKTVSPDLYVGAGLSGELQHMVGVSGAKLMLAINNDPKAPVFEQVDIGVVDDYKEFIPVLIEELKKFKAKQ